MIQSDLHQLFSKQLETNPPVTEEQLKQRKTKTYFNNEPIKTGDIVLYAIIEGEFIRINEHSAKSQMTIIVLNQTYFDLFEQKYETSYQTHKLPIIKYK